jgi:hypothetical protein
MPTISESKLKDLELSLPGFESRIPGQGGRRETSRGVRSTLECEKARGSSVPGVGADSARGKGARTGNWDSNSNLSEATTCYSLPS